MSLIVDNVRTFARSQKASVALIDIHQPLKAALMLVTAQLRSHNIAVTETYDTDLPKVMADGNQLQQVFLNLLTNARDALDGPGGGKVWVVSRMSQGSASRQGHGTGSPTKEIEQGTDRGGPWRGRHVEVVLGNDGPPIPANIIDRIFDPFFTTKEPGQGTGLGLYISDGIIRACHGQLIVENKKDVGVEFRIVLPVTEVT
jgi:signal transduction histidine kinase